MSRGEPTSRGITQNREVDVAVAREGIEFESHALRFRMSARIPVNYWGLGSKAGTRTDNLTTH